MIKNTFTNPQIQTSAFAQKPILIPMPPVMPNISRILGSNTFNNNPLSQQLLPGSLANNPLAATQANNPATAGKSQAAWTNAGGCGCGSKGCGGGNGGDKTGPTGQPNSAVNSPANNAGVDQNARDNVIQNPRNINTP